MTRLNRNYPWTEARITPVKLAIEATCEYGACDRPAKYGYLPAHGKLGRCYCEEHMPKRDREYAETH